MKCGDKNTTYFHQKANQREHHNNVQKLKNEAGNCFEDEDEITKCFAAYFETLSSSNNSNVTDPMVNLVQPLINAEMAVMLGAPFLCQDVVFALSQMHPNKAPGPDGMNAFFYQNFWNIVWEDVTNKMLIL